MAQVNLALIKGCALSNTTGLLPRDGMLYFFVQKGSLQNPIAPYDVNEEDPLNNYALENATFDSLLMQPVQCCVVYYAGSSADDWPLASVYAADTRQAFTTEPAFSSRAYASTAPASDVSLTAPPFAAHQMLTSLSGGGGRSDTGSGNRYCSETEKAAEDDYRRYSSEAGPDRRAPLMLGHCAPPLWMAGARVGYDGSRETGDMQLADMMMSKLRDVCYPTSIDAFDFAANTGTVFEKPDALSDDTVPLLQFQVNYPVMDEYYLVFVARK